MTARPWDSGDVRPLPPVGAHAATLPGSGDDEDDDVPGGGADDTAPPVVAERRVEGSSARTVLDR